jgi:hypothetical protein
LKLPFSGYANSSIGAYLAVNDTMIPSFELGTCRDDHPFPTCHHYLSPILSRWRVSETLMAIVSSLERTPTHVMARMTCCSEPRRRLEFHGCPHSKSLASTNEMLTVHQRKHHHQHRASQTPPLVHGRGSVSVWLLICKFGMEYAHHLRLAMSPCVTGNKFSGHRSGCPHPKYVHAVSACRTNRRLIIEIVLCSVYAFGF